jgi:hypothetical protein
MGAAASNARYAGADSTEGYRRCTGHCRWSRGSRSPGDTRQSSIAKGAVTHSPGIRSVLRTAHADKDQGSVLAQLAKLLSSSTVNVVINIVDDMGPVSGGANIATWNQDNFQQAKCTCEVTVHFGAVGKVPKILQ